MARHAVAVAFAVLIHALLGLVSAMPGPRSAGPRLQCPNCFKPFLKHSHFRLHQASMAKTACGRDVSQPMASGWSGGARAAGNVEDLSGQRRAGQADFSEPADGAQRMVFFFRSLYDAVKQLLRSARLAGRQYTEFEKVYSVGHKRKYGAINRGEMYEISQGHAGRDVSPLPVFLSSDATVICKKMGAHPIISECANMFFSPLYCMYVYELARICMYQNV